MFCTILLLFIFITSFFLSFFLRRTVLRQSRMEGLNLPLCHTTSQEFEKEVSIFPFHSSIPIHFFSFDSSIPLDFIRLRLFRLDLKHFLFPNLVRFLHLQFTQLFRRFFLEQLFENDIRLVLVLVGRRDSSTSTKG